MFITIELTIIELKCAIEVVQRHANNVIKYSMLEKLIINLNSFHQKHGIGNS